MDEDDFSFKPDINKPREEIKEMIVNKDDKDDIDFKPDIDEVNDKVDEQFKKHGFFTRDKLKLLNDIKEKPPAKGDMTVDIEEGRYAIDLRALLDAQITDCPATVIPMLIDHGVRNAVDIKDTYRPEKRFVKFEYWWVLILIIGLGAGIMILQMLFGIF